MDVVFELEQRALRENPRLLGDASLAQLRKYKYSSVDRSLTSKYVLNPFWTWCAARMPLWLAPNCITLIGVSAIVACNALVLLLQGGDLATAMPRGVYAATAAAFFFYQTMDNVDGKQARRTGTSSPLGELFDHGIDSLNCLWGALLMVATLSAGSSWTGVVNLLAPTVGMYFSTWETYYTKTLFLDYLNAPTEGLLVACAFHLAAALGGPALLTEATIPGTPWPLGMLWTGSLVVSVLALHIPSCVRNVHRRVGARAFWRQAVPNLLPAALLAAAVLVWAGAPGGAILGGRDTRRGHLFLFGWALSFTFGRVSTTVILSHLCNQPFPRLSLPLVLLVLGAVLYGVLPRLGLAWAPLGELAYLRLYFAAAMLYFLAFARLVIARLTHYLGITAFTVRRF